MQPADLAEKLKTKLCIIDCHTHVGVDYQAYTKSGFPYCMSFEDLVIRLKHLGVDHAVVFPFVNSGYHMMNDEGKIEICEDVSAFPYELENQNLLKEIHEIFPEHAECAIPFAIFDPSRKAAEQAAFLEKLHAKYGLFGLKTCPTYIQSFIKDLENEGKPILDFAKENDLPVVLHSAYIKTDPWASVYDIIEFVEKHPEIRFCIAHTARFTREIVDRASQMEHCFVDLSAFCVHCTLACDNHDAVPPAEKRLDLNYEDPADAMAAVCRAYPDTIIWGTDTPFYYWVQKFYDEEGTCHELTLRSSFDREVEILKGLPEDTRQTVAWKNTVRFLFGE